MGKRTVPSDDGQPPVAGNKPAWKRCEEFYSGLFREVLQLDLDERLRYLFIRKVVSRFAQGARALDLGCGGHSTEILCGILPHTYALDVAISKRILRVYEENDHLPLVKGSGICLPFRGETFDFLLCSEVLEHVPIDLQPTLLDEIYRVLKTSGILVLTTPNPYSVSLLLSQFLYEIGIIRRYRSGQPLDNYVSSRWIKRRIQQRFDILPTGSLYPLPPGANRLPKNIRLVLETFVSETSDGFSPEFAGPYQCMVLR